MSKQDLTYVTFNIPVKIDCPERLHNLEVCISYLQHHFATHIIVYEVSEDGVSKIPFIPDIKHHIKKLGNELFHRTKYLNEMALLSNTSVIANYDCDVLIPPDQLVLAAKGCNNGECDGCYPYNGLFVNMPRSFIPRILKDMDLSFVDVKTTENFGTNSMGGAIFWNKAKFIDGGMENEHFVSWGYEDWERLNRFRKLGYKIGRTGGALYHISHPRGKDSCDANPAYKHNGKVYDAIMAMSKEQLRAYIDKQPWMNGLKSTSNPVDS